MSECRVANPAASPAALSGGGRAARLARFKREQRIVGYLNRGVSVAEIAAQIGIGEKRMRAVIKDILARRMPHPPEEFVAVQLSRLNEALLVAFSAMSPANLKAVDQVVKIVRELDRYGGAFAAEWALPKASPGILSGSRAGGPGLEAPTEADVAFAKAWLGGAEPESESSDDRPEIPAQSLENIESAPGLLQTSEAAGDADWRQAREDASLGLSAGSRPEISAQRLEKIESAPGIPAGPAAPAPLAACQPEEGRGKGLSGLSVPARQTSHPDRLPLIPGSSPAKGRPENLAQSLEKVESAPGFGSGSRTAEAAPVSAVSTPDLMLSLLRSATGRGELRACLSGLRAGMYDIARQHGGGDLPFAAHTGRDRPEIPAQRIENMESAPGNRWLDDAGSGSLPSPLVPYPIGPGRFHKTFDDVGAC